LIKPFTQTFQASSHTQHNRPNSFIIVASLAENRNDTESLPNQQKYSPFPSSLQENQNEQSDCSSEHQEPSFLSPLLPPHQILKASSFLNLKKFGAPLVISKQYDKINFFLQNKSISFSQFLSFFRIDSSQRYFEQFVPKQRKIRTRPKQSNMQIYFKKLSEDNEKIMEEHQLQKRFEHAHFNSLLTKCQQEKTGAALLLDFLRSLLHCNKPCIELKDSKYSSFARLIELIKLIQSFSNGQEILSNLKNHLLSSEAFLVSRCNHNLCINPAHIAITSQIYSNKNCKGIVVYLKYFFHRYQEYLVVDQMKIECQHEQKCFKITIKFAKK
jgi:hypothetical protein